MAGEKLLEAERLVQRLLVSPQSIYSAFCKSTVLQELPW